MAQNEGKRFEKNIKDSCERQGILFERLPDSNKFGGSDAGMARFTPDNPFDGFIFYNGHLCCLELKTAKTGSISFNQPPDAQPKGKPKPSIKAHQVKNLMARAEYPGVKAGLLVEFSDRETKTQMVAGGTFFIDIGKWYQWAVNSGKKSMNVSDARGIGIPVESAKLKVNARYDIRGMLERICDG